MFYISNVHLILARGNLILAIPMIQSHSDYKSLKDKNGLYFSLTVHLFSTKHKENQLLHMISLDKYFFKRLKYEYFVFVFFPIIL